MMSLRILVLFFVFFTCLNSLDASAGGADVRMCNQSDERVRVTVVDQHWEGGSEMSWREDGWYAISPGNCRFIKSIPIGWAAFAFSVGERASFRSFVYRPSETYNPSRAIPPSFSHVCTTDGPGAFGRDGLQEYEIGRSCARSADQLVPISFMIHAGAFTNARLTVNISNVPPPDAETLAAMQAREEEYVFLGEVNGCRIVAAPSITNADITVDGKTLSQSEIYDYFMVRALRAIEKFRRELRCIEIQGLRSQFYPFIKDDSGSTHQVFMYQRADGLVHDEQTRTFKIPESDKVYEGSLFVLGIKKL
ncbi:MAG: hypothetical protein AAF636_21910 [Pseudomonadota bacterium]